MAEGNQWISILAWLKKRYSQVDPTPLCIWEVPNHCKSPGVTIGVLKIWIQDTHILLSLLNIMISGFGILLAHFMGKDRYIIYHHISCPYPFGHDWTPPEGPLLRHDPVSYTLDRNATAEDPWGSDDLASASTPSGWVLLGWGMSPPNIKKRKRVIFIMFYLFVYNMYVYIYMYAYIYICMYVCMYTLFYIIYMHSFILYTYVLWYCRWILCGGSFHGKHSFQLATVCLPSWGGEMLTGPSVFLQLEIHWWIRRISSPKTRLKIEKF